MRGRSNAQLQSETRAMTSRLLGGKTCIFCQAAIQRKNNTHTSKTLSSAQLPHTHQPPAAEIQLTYN